MSDSELSELSDSEVPEVVQLEAGTMIAHSSKPIISNASGSKCAGSCRQVH